MAAPPGYVLAFSDEFDGPLDVSNWGPGTKWIAHTPYNGDFGYAKFGIATTGYGAGNLSTSGSNLVIKWTVDPTDPTRWRQQGGLISSGAADSSGFCLSMGYWEARIKFPDGQGVWGGFWMDSINGIHQPRTIATCEIDVIEYYGEHTTWMFANTLKWGIPPLRVVPGGMGQTILDVGVNLTADFHVYGCLVDSDYTYFYFDDKLVARGATFKECLEPLYVMLDFATSIESTRTTGIPLASPSYMYCDYVRAYSPAIGAGTSFFPSLYLDTPDQLGPVAGIIPNVTPLNATGSRQGDQLGVYQNLIDNTVKMQGITGIINSIDATSQEYKIRRKFWRQWSAYDAMPTSGTSGLFVLSNATVCLAFPATTVTTVCFMGMVPWNTVLDDGAIIRIRWSSSVTGGNAIFGAALEKQCVTAVTSDSFDTPVTASVAAPGTVNTIQTTSITQTHLDGLALGDTFRLRIQRLDNDTLAGTVNVYMITIEGAT